MIGSASTTTSERPDSTRIGSVRQRVLSNSFVLMLTDAASLWASVQLVVLFISLFWRRIQIEPFSVAVWVVVWILSALASRLYPTYGIDAPEKLRRTVNTSVTNVLATLGAAFLTRLNLPGSAGLTPMLSLILASVVAVPVILTARFFMVGLLVRLGFWGVPVLVAGDGPTALELSRVFRATPSLGFHPRPYSIEQIHHVARAIEVQDGNLSAFAKGFGVDAIAFLASPSMPYRQREALLEGPLALFRDIYVAVDSPALDAGWVNARYFGTIKTLELRRRHLEPAALVIKRSIDLFVVLLALPLALPLMLMIALWIRLDSPGPVFYDDERLGLRGRRFRCLKFRTMVPNAEQKLKEMLERDPEARKEYDTYHKLKNDPRITRAGRFLRGSSLDELPQILNILMGQMAFVGPRPYLPRERPKMEPYAELILSCRPGLTGWWQVEARSKARFDERLQMDLLYVRRWSIWLDLMLFVRTVTAVFASKGAY